MGEYQGIHSHYWGKAMVPAPLQGWFMENQPKKEMFYAEAQGDQIMFVRDTLTQLFARSLLEYRRLPKVISTHTSKSVKLPVYYFDTPWARFVMRCNFYDWKISVSSKVGPLDLDLEGLCGTSENISDCYCEGFLTDWVFPCYSKNKERFTVELRSREEVYTFLFLVRRSATKQGKLNKAYVSKRLGHLSTLVDKLEEFKELDAAKKVPFAQRMHGYTIRGVFESLLAEVSKEPGVPLEPKLREAFTQLHEGTQYKIMDHPKIARPLITKVRDALASV